MLARASFTYFKNLRRIDVDLGRLTVLVGPNGAGKTSIMQGIHLLSQLGNRWSPEDRRRGHPFARVFSGRWTPGRLVTTGEAFFRIAFSEGGEGADEPVEVASLMVSTSQDPDSETDPVIFTLDLPGVLEGHVAASRERVIGGAPDTVFNAPRLRRLSAVVFLHLDAALMVRPSVVEHPEPRLEYDGEGLASVLAYLAGAHPDRKEAIEADAAAIVPWFRRVLVRPEKVSRLATRPFPVGREAVNVPVEEEIWGHRFAVETTDGSVVAADLLSEGTVLVLGLLTLLHDPNPPKIVLVDDLDRALHLGAQVRLVRCLRTILDRRPELQIVASTHSPFLLQEIPATDVRVLGLTRSGVRCRSLSEHPDYERWRTVLGTGEMWANLGEDWVGDGG